MTDHGSGGVRAVVRRLLGHGRGLPGWALLLWLILVAATPPAVIFRQLLLTWVPPLAAMVVPFVAEAIAYVLIRLRPDVRASHRAGSLTSGLAIVQGVMIIATALVSGWQAEGVFDPDGLFGFGRSAYVDPVLVEVFSPRIGNALAAAQPYAIGASVAAWLVWVVVASLEYGVGRGTEVPRRSWVPVLVSVPVFVACAAGPVGAYWQQLVPAAPGEVLAVRGATPVAPYPDYPRVVPGPASVRQVVSAGYGGDIGYALDGEGVVWTWGSDILDPTGGPTLGAHRVAGLPPVVSIAAHGHGAAALDAAGTVWTWGLARDCTLGEAGAVDRAAPAQVPGLTGVTTILASNSTMYAITATGVLSWGRYVPGVANRASTDTCDASTPTHIDVGNAAQIIDQDSSLLVLRTDGSVWQQESATGLDQGLPRAQVSGLPRAVAISANGSRSFALADDGTVWSWWAGPSTTPAPERRLTGVASINGGLALMKDGTVWDLDWQGSGNPQQVTGLRNIVAIADSPDTGLLAVQG